MSDGRHLPWHLFQENYLDPGVPALLSISGTPEMHIVFQPQPGLLGLITDTHGEKPVPIDRRNIFSDFFDLNGQTTSRVYVRDEPLFREFYAICTEVADRCQTGSEPYEVAVTDTIEAFDLLLRSAIALSANQEIGLVGELLILDSLIRIKGPTAVDGWRGADRDKHDFRIDDQEIEVKTTTGNKRQHWIHGLTQLDASNNCQLDLISVHFARTAGEGTLSLNSLVNAILAGLEGTASATEQFKTSLQKAVGDERLDLAEGQFHFRSDVIGYKVGEAFPRLSAESVRAAIGESTKHVADVNYLLNLDELASTGYSSMTAEILEEILRRYA